jgi:hypothetical protein
VTTNNDSYDYFWCPGCSNYRHTSVENIIRVAHMTKIMKRQDNTDNFYTTSLSFLCNFCIKKAKEEDEEEKTKEE